MFFKPMSQAFFSVLGRRCAQRRQIISFATFLASLQTVRKLSGVRLVFLAFLEVTIENPEACEHHKDHRSRPKVCWLVYGPDGKCLWVMAAFRATILQQSAAVLERSRLTALPTPWLGYLGHSGAPPRAKVSLAALLQHESHRNRRSVQAHLCYGFGARRNSKRSLGDETFSVRQQLDLLLLGAGQYGQFR